LRAEQFYFTNAVAGVAPAQPGSSPGSTEPSRNTSVTEILRGTERIETVKGRSGDEILVGRSSADRLVGGDGNDILKGKKGKDLLFGGAGSDAFVFDTKITKSTHKKHVDKIRDFNVKDDAIWLDNSAFKSLGKRGSLDDPASLNKKHFRTGSKAKDQNDYIIYDKAKGVLYYDQDGSGKGAALQIALLDKKLKISASDFFVV
jgi:Ca2+-binding RTX toxin-like protein